MRNIVLKRWQGEGGFGQVFHLALPLIISTGMSSVQMFVDRTFLSWYSTDAMAAAMQAGIASFSIASLFLGTASYVNTFVAQYTGAGRDERCGPAVWQGIHFSIFAGLAMLILIPLAQGLFNWMGHDLSVRHYEVTYFRIMCIGVLPMLVSSSLSGFFTGRGQTKIVMYIDLLSTGVNIGLDYILIFGVLGFPRMGIAGAAIATVISYIVSVLLFFYLFSRKQYRTKSATLQGWRFDSKLFLRLIRYGLPNGIQFMLDVCAFAAFVMLVGRINKTALTATSMAFSINTLAFMPMIGFGIAVNILVGQSLGRNEPATAVRSTWSAFYLTYGYMTVLALCYWLFPQIFLYPFKLGITNPDFPSIEKIVKNLLLFVAFYCLFDTGNIVFSGALKGAGDTRFVMVVTVVLSWLVMVLPSFLAVRSGLSLYWPWSFVTAYVCILALVFLFRFLGGKWKNMRVIEKMPPKMPPELPQVPTAEI